MVCFLFSVWSPITSEAYLFLIQGTFLILLKSRFDLNMGWLSIILFLFLGLIFSSGMFCLLHTMLSFEYFLHMDFSLNILSAFNILWMSMKIIYSSQFLLLTSKPCHLVFFFFFSLKSYPFLSIHSLWFFLVGMIIYVRNTS